VTANVLQGTAQDNLSFNVSPLEICIKMLLTNLQIFIPITLL